jgi:hypothetical protein
MRIPRLMFIATIGLIASASTEAAPVAWPALDARVLPVNAPDSTQPAIWTPRKLQNFGIIITDDTTRDRGVSCAWLGPIVKGVLLRLGARASDLDVDERNCKTDGGLASIDATFSVLASNEKSIENAAGVAVPARWQIIEFTEGHGNCDFLNYITKKVLPLFSTRDVKLISQADCRKFGVGLRAQVLMPPQPDRIEVTNAKPDSASAPLEADKAMIPIPHGYKRVVMDDGEVRYCRTDIDTGSRVESRKVCVTAEQADQLGPG